MKEMALGVLVICLLLVAGCSTGGPAAVQKNGGLPATAGLPGGTSPFMQQNISQPALLTNGSYSISVSIDRIETVSPRPGTHRLDIYVHVENTGMKSLLPIWYSRVTDSRGVAHGGVGVSHGGAGVEGPLLDPGSSVLARDYITIGSDADLAVLAEGGTLDIVFLGYRSDLTPAVTFRAAWALEPGIIG